MHSHAQLHATRKGVGLEWEWIYHNLYRYKHVLCTTDSIQPTRARARPAIQTWRNFKENLGKILDPPINPPSLSVLRFMVADAIFLINAHHTSLNSYLVQPMAHHRGLWCSICDGMYWRRAILILEGLQKLTSCKYKS